jgi:8-oxo-dGTP diphosphatase
VAALCRRAGRILLTRRRSDQVMPRCWELPGGKVEPGEAPDAALRRELREELGVESRVGRAWDVVFYRYPTFDLLMIVYRCRILGEPRALEVADVRWVEPRRLGGYKCLPADEELQRRLSRADARTSGMRRT